MDEGLCRWDNASVYSDDGGKTWKPRPSGAVQLHPGMDYQCFPGLTKIESFFDNERIYRRTYHGAMTTLITSKGKIDCTPNHPILTDKGWCPAKFINIGDSIVKVKRERFLADGTNPQNSIATFDELFSFFSVFLDRERIRLGDKDFHGDISVDQKVNVITTKSVLRNYIKADIGEAFFQKVFAEADTVTLGKCKFVSDLFRDCFPSHCGMGFFGKADSFLGSGMRHSGDHPLGAIAWVQFILNKATVDGSPSCAELFGNSLDTHARLEQFAYFLFWELFSVMRWVLVMNRGISPSPHSNVKIATKDAFELGNLIDVHSSDIEFDTIVDKVIIPDYKGHIYNLQNTNGWYMVSPEHYIVKNCRCTALSYWDELVDEVDAKIAQYEELDALSAQNIAAMPKPAPPEPPSPPVPQPKKAAGKAKPEKAKPVKQDPPAKNGKTTEPEASGETAETAINSKLSELREWGKTTKREQASMMTQDGKAIGSAKGTVDEVVLSAKMMQALDKQPSNSLVLLHNHPDSTSFSKTDFSVMCKHHSIKELRVVGTNGKTYRVSVGNGERPTLAEMEKYENEIETRIRQEMAGKMVKRQLPKGENVWSAYLSERNAAFAEKYGWEYKEDRLDG
jgi:hypothetical protein